MEEKRRSKRPKPMEEGVWDCSVCTYRNSAEAFKCDMCDVRKGTSTRKPRLNPSLVAQQVAQQFTPPGLKEKKEKKKDKEKTIPTTSQKKGNRVPRIKNIDRSTAHSMEVTVGNVTVIITDYKLKKEKERKEPKESDKDHTSGASEQLEAKDSDVSTIVESNSDSVNSSRSDSQMDSDILDKTDSELNLKS